MRNSRSSSQGQPSSCPIGSGHRDVFSMRAAAGIGEKRARAYGMRCIAGLANREFTAAVSQKHADRESDIRLNHAQARGSRLPNEKQLKGVSRLMNPRVDEAELGLGDDDPGERDYVGRLLHVADEALHHEKRRGSHRKRRRVH